jgi:hypothetical protein
MTITLLTDFGLKDEYVGVMKGVILGICPEARVVDLTHEIPPGDIRQAAWILAWAWSYFPPGTVHVVVVDPDVGTQRKILCAEIHGHRFLAADNGVLSVVLHGVARPKVHEVRNRRYCLPNISRTFHGRDIFAPVAAHIAKGLAISQLGPQVRSFRRIQIPQPTQSRDGGWVGEVIHLDRFGNAVTNISETLWKASHNRPTSHVQVNRRSIPMRQAYASVPEGNPLAIVGSRGLLEIAVFKGSAAQRLNLKIGDRVKVKRDGR